MLVEELSATDLQLTLVMGELQTKMRLSERPCVVERELFTVTLDSLVKIIHMNSLLKGQGLIIIVLEQEEEDL